MKRTLLSVCACLVWLGSACADDGWVLKADDFSLPLTVLEDTLEARGFGADMLHGKQGEALLQEMFLRESLLLRQSEVPEGQMQLLDKQVDDFRKTTLSKLVLDVLSAEGMPDFASRAQELYEARKDSQYRLPLRLRVRGLQKRLGSDAAAVRATLEKVRGQVSAGELDFVQAVQEYSDADGKGLTQGDSFWFHQGQKAQPFYQVADSLSAEKPLSEVFVHQDVAYLLQFIGRQEAMVQTYAEVKDAILAELKEEYQQQQRKLILEGLRTRFQQNVEIHPDYQ